MEMFRIKKKMVLLIKGEEGNYTSRLMLCEYSFKMFLSKSQVQ